VDGDLQSPSKKAQPRILEIANELAQMDLGHVKAKWNEPKNSVQLGEVAEVELRRGLGTGEVWIAELGWKTEN